MPGERKRAPGAGRKPQGEISGKSATLTTRIRPDTREMLEAAAAASGRSVSQEAELRLRQSFRVKDDETPARNKALADVVLMLAQQAEERTGLPWTSDPFTFEVVAEGIRFLLERLEKQAKPPQQMNVPEAAQAFAAVSKNFGALGVDPWAMGEWLAESLIFQIRTNSTGSNSIDRYAQLFRDLELKRAAK